MSDLHKFESTIQHMHQFHVYRGNPGCPDILVSCPDEAARDAGFRLLNMPDPKPKKQQAMCGCGFAHGPGDRCGPF